MFNNFLKINVRKLIEQTASGWLDFLLVVLNLPFFLLSPIFLQSYRLASDLHWKRCEVLLSSFRIYMARSSPLMLLKVLLPPEMIIITWLLKFFSCYKNQLLFLKTNFKFNFSSLVIHSLGFSSPWWYSELCYKR